MAAASPTIARSSAGLDQFFQALAGLSGLSILDLGGASQANVGFITGMGYRLYSEDFLRSLDTAFGDGNFYANQLIEERIERFCSQCLDFEEGQLDGVLLWDSLEYLSPPLLGLTLEQIHRILRPGGVMLAYFHTDERAAAVPAYSYRIADTRQLQLTERGQRKPAQHFHNRAIERVFRNFSSIKFYLTRDNLREVLVRR